MQSVNFASRMGFPGGISRDVTLNALRQMIQARPRDILEFAINSLNSRRVDAGIETTMAHKPFKRGGYLSPAPASYRVLISHVPRTRRIGRREKKFFGRKIIANALSSYSKSKKRRRKFALNWSFNDIAKTCWIA